MLSNWPYGYSIPSHSAIEHETILPGPHLLVTVGWIQHSRYRKFFQNVANESNWSEVVRWTFSLPRLWLLSIVTLSAIPSSLLGHLKKVPFRFKRNDIMLPGPKCPAAYSHQNFSKRYGCCHSKSKNVRTFAVEFAEAGIQSWFSNKAAYSGSYPERTLSLFYIKNQLNKLAKKALILCISRL